MKKREGEGVVGGWMCGVVRSWEGVTGLSKLSRGRKLGRKKERHGEERQEGWKERKGKEGRVE